MLQKTYEHHGKTYTPEELALVLCVPYYELRRVLVSCGDVDLDKVGIELRGKHKGKRGYLVEERL